MPKPSIKLSKSVVRDWTKFKQRWKDCQECPLCESRKHMALYRGSLPCDVLFVGEAPGPSENAFGSPFVGPAGDLLEEIISDTKTRLTDNDNPWDFSYGFLNLVCCYPKDGNKFRQPIKKEIVACRERLIWNVRIAKPRFIILVGLLAHRHFPKDEHQQLIEVCKHNFISYCDMIHPAAILRMEEDNAADLAFKKASISLYETLSIPF